MRQSVLLLEVLDKMEKKIEIKIPKQHGDVYLAMHVPENMGASELLRVINANELAEFNIQSGHLKLNEHYRNSGELEDRSLYDIHTSDPDKTVDLIQKYKHRN